MIRYRANNTLLTVLLSIYVCAELEAQPEFGFRNHFHSRESDLLRVMKKQESLRDHLARREATALGPQNSWALMLQSSRFRNFIPTTVTATLNFRVRTHWSAGLGCFVGTRSGPVLQTDASVGRWIVQGKLAWLTGSKEHPQSNLLTGIGIRRRQLITPGLWCYILAEYQWNRTIAGGSLITWMGLEWQVQSREGRDKGRFPTKARWNATPRRLSTAIQGWSKRGIFD